MTSSFKIGDGFIKTGDLRRNVWVVTRSWTHVDGLLHVQLVKQTQMTDLITVSATTLTDGSYFKPVSGPG